jgi:hypothetical protein
MCTCDTDLHDATQGNEECLHREENEGRKRTEEKTRLYARKTGMGTNTRNEYNERE